MKKLFFAFSILSSACFSSEVVNDITQINPIIVDRVITPTSIEEIQDVVAKHKGIISIGGGRYSMGGQTATENTLQIDMRKMNKIVNIDVIHKKVTVQAGARWRDIQDAIDPKNLSIKIMQTYSNFTVGGSLSVNVHGRYVGQGPLIRSVDSIKVVLGDGSLIEATPTNRPDIFYGAIGGYGGIGVIVEATLQLADNEKVERVAKLIPASEYKNYFFSDIKNNPKVIFHNGDIYPPTFTQVNAVSWVKTDKPLTLQERLIPRNVKYILQPAAITAMTSLPLGRKIRAGVIDPLIYSKEMVVWRNHEASYDVAELEPASRRNSTYVLQEYFIPVDKFDEFIPKMSKVFSDFNVDVFNVSIRHALPDPGSLLAWAKQEVFAFVVYYRQGTNPADKMEVGNWTRAMIAEALSLGGTYYLPYQIHATDNQFHRAYPRFQEYFDLKAKVDPDYKFRNKLWDRYYISIPDEISAITSTLKGYKRGEEQSFLGLPEWYIVFNGDEYASFLKSSQPSKFPYLASFKEFWDLKSTVKKITKDKYPSNFGYNVMLWVIGTSYTTELVIKGIYENTIGRFTEFLSSSVGTSEDRMIQRFHQEYADFVHIYPWYEFQFFTRLKEFWKDNSLWDTNLIRKWERKAFFTTEYLVKSIYGWVIKVGTQMSYEPEATEIFAVISDLHDSFKNVAAAHPEINIIKSSGTVHLASFPRYDKFRDLLMSVSNSEFKFIEIAGNRKIFLTVIADKGTEKLFVNGEVVGISDIPTSKTKDRLLISTSVSSLMDFLNTVKKANLEVEHIFDY
jgi:FAD/FMN-containing dehydrogenase